MCTESVRKREIHNVYDETLATTDPCHFIIEENAFRLCQTIFLNSPISLDHRLFFFSRKMTDYWQESTVFGSQIRDDDDDIPDEWDADPEEKVCS